MPEIGLVSVSFRALNPREIVNLCLRSGLPYIEWGSDVHAKPDDTVCLAEIAKMQKESGLRCSSYGTYFRIGQQKSDEIEPYFDAADILGTDILRLWCGTKSSSDYTADERKTVIEDCVILAEKAKKRGKRLLMECHNETLTDDTDSSFDLMKSVGSPAFGMMWQPNQFRTFEYNLDSAKRLAPYVGNVHVFEWDEKNRYPLMDGAEKWRQYFALLPDVRYDLLEFVPNDDPKILPREAEALKNILSKVNSE